MNLPCMTTKKTCRDCGELKSLFGFGVQRGSPDGRRPECSECARGAANKKYRAKQKCQWRHGEPSR